MAVEVEIVERSSVIVVTLTGRTDIGALEPLNDALQVAASEGKTVVLDIRELAHASPLTGIIDVLRPAAGTVKIVANPSATTKDPPGGYREVYTSVDAAIDAVRSANGNPSAGDLVAKFDDLRIRYEQTIDTCRQLLESAENYGKDVGRPSKGS